MATINQRPNGKWQARIRRDGKVKTKTFSTKSDADAWSRKIESEIERGLWHDGSIAERTKLKNALKDYKSELTSLKKGKVQEDSVIDILLDDPIAELTLARVRAADISALVERWRKVNYAPATIQRRLSILKHLFEVARKRWGMESLANPVKLVQLPPLNNCRERRVEEAEILAICAESSSTLLPSIVRIAVETGMRRGEIAALRWSNIDLKKRVAHLSETKNGAKRDVPLSSRATSILESMPRNISGEVFNIRADAISQAFERAVSRCRESRLKELKAAGAKISAIEADKFCQDLRFHDLRHEATSRLAEKLEMHELMKVTGHKDPRMLARYYHPRAEDLAKKLG